MQYVSLEEVCRFGGPLTAVVELITSLRVAKLRTSTVTDQEQWLPVLVTNTRDKRQPLVTPVGIPELEVFNFTDLDGGTTVEDNSTDTPTAAPSLAPRVARPTPLPPSSPAPTAQPTELAGNETEVDRSTRSPTRGPFNLGDLPPLVWDAATCSCSNVPVGADVTFSHELFGELSRVSVDLVLDTVSAGKPGVETCDRTPAEVDFTFTSLFRITNTVGEEPRPKAGNPGYRANFPLLAGNLDLQVSCLPSPTPADLLPSPPTTPHDPPRPLAYPLRIKPSRTPSGDHCRRRRQLLPGGHQAGPHRLHPAAHR